MDPAGRVDTFALAATLLCAAAGAGVWFAWAAPALRERDALERVETDHVRLRDQLAARLGDLRVRQAALEWDVQTLLVAIDAAGLTPAELLGTPVPAFPAAAAWNPTAR